MTTLTHGNSETISLPAFQTLTVAASAGSRGRVTFMPLVEGGLATGFVDLAPSESRTYGPYSAVTRYKVESFDNVVTTTIGTAPLVRSAASSTFIELFGTAAPVDGAQATRNVNPAGDDNALTFTAVAYGVAGNDISVSYLDPGAANVSLSVAVDLAAKHIAVTLATNGSSVITSTAAEVLAAIEASADASSLVTVAVNTADTGTADDGSGVVTAMARGYLTGGAGTGVGTAGPGSRFTDEVGGDLYINTGTLAAPVWDIATVS